MRNMEHINIKPLSVNEAYRGRKFSTEKLQSYKQIIPFLLPKIKIPKGKLQVKYVFGVSSKNSDGDNLIKAFQDILQEHYGFNDREIYKWVIEKRIVPKGQEYIGFDIKSYLCSSTKGVDNSVD